MKNVNENEVKFTNKEVLLKEVDLIQACISRMAHNSFLIKGWVLTICTAVLVVSIRKQSVSISVIAFIPLCLFWCLDSFFFATETKFRRLYAERIVQRLEGNLENAFELEIKNIHPSITWKSELFNYTFMMFYGALFFLLLIYVLINSICVS